MDNICCTLCSFQDTCMLNNTAPLDLGVHVFTVVLEDFPTHNISVMYNNGKKEHFSKTSPPLCKVTMQFSLEGEWFKHAKGRSYLTLIERTLQGALQRREHCRVSTPSSTVPLCCLKLMSASAWRCSYTEPLVHLDEMRGAVSRVWKREYNLFDDLSHIGLVPFRWKRSWLGPGKDHRCLVTSGPLVDVAYKSSWKGSGNDLWYKRLLGNGCLWPSTWNQFGQNVAAHCGLNLKAERDLLHLRVSLGQNETENIITIFQQYLCIRIHWVIITFNLSLHCWPWATTTAKLAGY